jgi:hypothetical protein
MTPGRIALFDAAPFPPFLPFLNGDGNGGNGQVIESPTTFDSSVPNKPSKTAINGAKTVRKGDFDSRRCLRARVMLGEAAHRRKCRKYRKVAGQRPVGRSRPFSGEIAPKYSAQSDAPAKRGMTRALALARLGEARMRKHARDYARGRPQRLF